PPRRSSPSAASPRTATCSGARSGAGPLRSSPPEARRSEGRLERTDLESVGRLGLVVAARRDVVWPVGVEERRENLDLPSPRSELELAAAVEPDPAGGTVVVEGEELAERPEPRRLDVERPGREGQSLHVREGVDRRGPGDPPAEG